MTAPAVLKHLDVIDNILPDSRSIEILHSKNLLNFEAAEETLCTIAPAFAFSVNIGLYSMISTLSPGDHRCSAILATPVIVKDKAPGRFASPNRHG